MPEFWHRQKSSVGAVEPWRGCDSAGPGNISGACAAAIAASLKLDSSHRGSAVCPKFWHRQKSSVGAVEPWRGCDSAGPGNISGACAAAIAASLKLDSSHRGSAVCPKFWHRQRSSVGAGCDCAGSRQRALQRLFPGAVVRLQRCSVVRLKPLALALQLRQRLVVGPYSQRLARQMSCAQSRDFR